MTTKEEVVYMEGWESDEEESLNLELLIFAKMFQQLGRKYKAKKDDEEDKKKKKKKSKSLSKKKKMQKEKETHWKRKM